VPIETEFIALGVAAKVVVVVENEDARLRFGAAIEPSSGKPADAAADYHEVVALLDRHGVKRKGRAVA
jgi:hypothetical protein